MRDESDGLVVGAPNRWPPVFTSPELAALARDAEHRRTWLSGSQTAARSAQAPDYAAYTPLETPHLAIPNG